MNFPSLSRFWAFLSHSRLRARESETAEKENFQGWGCWNRSCGGQCESSHVVFIVRSYYTLFMLSHGWQAENTSGRFETFSLSLSFSFTLLPFFTTKIFFSFHFFFLSLRLLFLRKSFWFDLITIYGALVFFFFYWQAMEFSSSNWVPIK